MPGRSGPHGPGLSPRTHTIQARTAADNTGAVRDRNAVVHRTDFPCAVTLTDEYDMR